MALNVEAGGALAQAIQEALQPKFMDNGWVADESDTTLAEYVTQMVIRGADRAQISQELGADLLGVGAEDAGVGEVADWLFQQVPVMAAQINGTSNAEQQQQEQAGDMQMDDVAVPGNAPSGPKAMRDGNGVRGRGRMLGQLNRQMDRNGDDKMLRIKGAAGGAGRVNSHSRREDTRRGRGGLANGLSRMMGNGRQGGMQIADPQQQMQLMQMLEMQNQMMAQMLNGQVPDMSAFNVPQGRGKSLFDRVDKRKPRHQNGTNGAGPDVEMSEDGNRKDAFDTMCRFNDKCTVPTCPFAHQGPVSPPGISVDLTDKCSFGVACQNTKCAGKHPSPAQRRQHLNAEVDCKFYPNCTNPACPFRHPDMPPCRNGADCTTPNCKFSHSKIMCRYNPCLNATCPYKHVEGQKRGKFEDKVWTADRLKSLRDHSEQHEELIIPGNGNSNAEAEMQPVEATIS